MTAAVAAALRACAAGIYPGEAGVELLTSHGGFLHRRDFTRFIHPGTSITDGATPMAEIDWNAAISALHAGRLPISGGERRVLNLAASIASGTCISLRDTLPGMDSQNLDLVTTAIRHAAGQPSPHP